MDEQGIELFGDVQSQHEPGKGLKRQENGTQRKENGPIPPGLAASGNGYAQRGAEKEHQSIVDPTENVFKLHIPYPLCSNNSAI